MEEIMENILILGSKCFDGANAAGLCGKRLMQGFINEGKDVYILGYSYSDIDEDALIKRSDLEFEFKYRKNRKVNKRIEALKQLLIPSIDTKLVDAYFKYACEVIEEYKITSVIGVYFPLESLTVLKKLKEKYSYLKILDYEVDSSIDIKEYTSRLSKYRINAVIKYLTSIYKVVDYIFVMKSHMEKQLSCFSKFKEKIKEIDVPCFINANSKVDVAKDKDTFDFLYAGFLDKQLYSPEPLFRMMETNIDKDNWRLHFYARGNCEDLINEKCIEDHRIINHGYVSNEKYEEEVAKADVLLSIEYKYKPNSIPSKVFNYFSICKPVLHFTANRNNFFIREYIEKYPLGLWVNDKLNEEDNRKMLDFIDNIDNISIDYKDVRDIFYMNTPEYSAKLILSLLGDKHS